MAQFYSGNGSDGSLTISASRDEIANSAATTLSSTANSGQKDAIVASAAGFAANDIVLIIQKIGTGVGNYEFNKIGSINGTTLTMKANLVNTYTAGAPNDVRVIKVKQYSSVSVDSGGNWNSNIGILAALCSGAITLNTGGTITAAGAGFSGGDRDGGAGGGGLAGNGESGSSPPARGSQSNNGTGGGGGPSTGNPGMAASGGGGGSVSAGSNGSCGNGQSCSGSVSGGTASSATATCSKMVFGGGGGGGGANYNANPDSYGGIGGSGGGIIILVAQGNISLNGGTLSANGNAGANSDVNSSNGGGGGGGGGGGCIRLLTPATLALGTGIATATGGNAGNQGNGTSGGGNGANGRIATISSATVTGTSNPTIDTSSTDTVTSSDLWADAGHYRRLMMGLG